MPDWDVVVIGGGAAGLSAAATAASAGLSCIVIDRMGGGGELMNLGPLQDVGEDLTGPDLMARLMEETTTAGAELGIAEVTGLTPEGTVWRVTTDDDSHTARAVILAIGLAPGTLGLGNEDAYEGRGVSYCGTCDGPLFRGEPVVVAGFDRWAQLEAHELTATASQVTLVTQGTPVPPVEGVTVLHGRITALEGAAGLDSVLVQPDGGGAPETLSTGVVFIQTGRRPALDFAPAGLARDPDGRLVTDAALHCGLPGLFAAGDARSGASRTLVVAMAEGRQAAESARDALNSLGNAAE